MQEDGRSKLFVPHYVEKYIYNKNNMRTLIQPLNYLF